jgi:tetratricopeptide (TPR) repeat protein
MAAAPVTADAFFDLVKRSGVVRAKRLEAYAAGRPPVGGEPNTAADAARAAIADGLLTTYQAEQLLAGRWRNFIVARKYLILERVGWGGSSAVFLAKHLVMKRLVALKVLPTDQAENPEALARFLREARAAALLDHPNIADFYDIDRAGNIYFLVMEFVYGPDLEGLVRARGPLAPARAAEYGRQAACALQHAHEAGLVHRDIKPGNLRVDRSGTVKLLDLGLVRIFQSDDGLTKGRNFSYVLGTLDYQAPEQAVDSHEVDIRADIYSLGASLYFLLTGRPVFPEGTVAEKLSWHQMKRPRPIGEYRKDVPAGLAAVADRMMAKAPSDRYQEPAEVVEALAEWTRKPIPPPSEDELPRLSKAARDLIETRPRPAGRPVTPAPRRVTAPAAVAKAAAPRATWLRVPPALARRPGRRAALVGAAAGAALAFVGTRNYGLVSGTPGPVAAVAPTSGAGPTPRPAAEPSAVIDLFDSVADLNPQIDAEAAPAAKAKLLARRGNLYGRLGRWRQAALDFARALELDPSDHWTWYTATPTRAETGDKDGYLNQCREMLRRFESSTDPLLFERIAKLWLLTPDCPGDPAVPARLADRALASDPRKRLYFWVLSTKGIAEHRAGRYAEAVTWLSKAIDAAPATTPQCKALSGLFLSMALRRLGRQEEARKAYERATEAVDRHQLQYGGDLGTEWGDWLMCRIVRREADELMSSAK